MRFLQATIQALNKHGLSLTYNSVQTGVYDVETGTAPLVKTPSVLKIYPKHLNATNYNFPNLIGKENYMFYLANSDLSFTPKLNDEIIYNSKTFLIQAMQEHVAEGQIVLYRLVGTKG